MDQSKCAICQCALREGENSICAPCLQKAINQQANKITQTSQPHYTPPQPPQPPQRPPANLKVISARAAAAAVSSHTSTGSHVHQLHADKSRRAAAKKQASSSRMSGHPAHPKPPPFATHSGRVCSVGCRVFYKGESFTHGLLRGTITVDRNSESILENIKAAIFGVWDWSFVSDQYPQPPREFKPQFFDLARSGVGQKPPSALHNNEVVARYLDDTKGEPNFELCFKSDQYLITAPWHPQPRLSTATSSSKPGPSKRGKRKASEGLNDEDRFLDDAPEKDNYGGSDSDDDLPSLSSLEFIQPKNKKFKPTPSTSTSTKITSQAITRNKAAKLKSNSAMDNASKHKTFDTSNIVHLSPPVTPPRCVKRTQSHMATQVPLTHVLPHNQTCK